MNKLNTLIAIALVAAAGAAQAAGDDVTYPANVRQAATPSVTLGGPVDYSLYSEGNAQRAAPVVTARAGRVTPKPFDAAMAAADLKTLYID